MSAYISIIPIGFGGPSRILHASHFGSPYPPSFINSDSSWVADSRKNSPSSGLKGSPFTSKTGSPSRLTGYSVVISPVTGSPSKVLNFKKPSFSQGKGVFSSRSIYLPPSPIANFWMSCGVLPVLDVLFAYSLTFYYHQVLCLLFLSSSSGDEATDNNRFLLHYRRKFTPLNATWQSLLSGSS
jgi:hypothetical protein